MHISYPGQSISCIFCIRATTLLPGEPGRCLCANVHALPHTFFPHLCPFLLALACIGLEGTGEEWRGEKHKHDRTTIKALHNARNLSKPVLAKAKIQDMGRKRIVRERDVAWWK